MLGRSPRLLQSPRTDRAELRRIGSALQRHEAVAAELLNVGRDGQAYWVEVHIVPLADAHGIISSGFITEGLQQEAAVLGVRALLKKEQTLEGLVALVQQVLAVGTPQPGS